MKIQNKEEIQTAIWQLRKQQGRQEDEVAFNKNWLREMEKAQLAAESKHNSHHERMQFFLSKRASAVILAGNGLVRTEESVAAHALLDDMAERLSKVEEDLWCQVVTASQLVEASRAHLEKCVKQVELTKREIIALTCVLETVDEDYLPPNDV